MHSRIVFCLHLLLLNKQVPFNNLRNVQLAVFNACMPLVHHLQPFDSFMVSNSFATKRLDLMKSIYSTLQSGMLEETSCRQVVVSM